VGFALAGGLVLGVGNLLTQYAWPFVGLSIVEVISSSITVVAGWYLITLHKILNIDFNIGCWDQSAWHKACNRSSVFVKLNLRTFPPQQQIQ
jgi:hypothetical protein